MPRRAAPSTSILARIRAWFGLQQQELALYLGISQQLVHSIESGRHHMSYLVADAMLPLARQLPEPITRLDEPLPAALPPSAPAPDAGELDFRRRVCLQRAAKLRAQAAKLASRAHYAHRWQQALPQLLPPPEAPDPEQAAWLTGWLQRRARPLTPEEVTRWHLLQAQAGALEAEAALLAAS
ncbi:helix-turn-helix transcriptional regulator [Hymenobacter metallicola]|uniref:Helix-turn-helix domain-containing protein n=1 Tax=Hymenobacter metallicola TaxID=2563114 RepID=A0A4Z0QFH0_9BACT|nr:helix-turn-helix domain-containing protein [Hymenobacter metallicola]TGE27452.1 helix-turn-helix domain-containing protein [Hymenobacter metallicola]